MCKSNFSSFTRKPRVNSYDCDGPKTQDLVVLQHSCLAPCIHHELEVDLGSLQGQSNRQHFSSCQSMFLDHLFEVDLTEFPRDHAQHYYISISSCPHFHDHIQQVKYHNIALISSGTIYIKWNTWCKPLVEHMFVRYAFLRALLPSQKLYVLWVDLNCCLHFLVQLAFTNHEVCLKIQRCCKNRSPQ